ncbi:MAG TPA: bifunctional diguanylate cyclase/phosphodiesterase [Hyphomonas sp.]|nr:bifunctional diguanylate cyclase/phosphodiesterase [Hyphomonas sp.]
MAGLILLMAIVYSLSPAPGDVASHSDPVWIAMAALAAGTVVRILLTRRSALTRSVALLLTVFEFSVLIFLIVCFAQRYSQPSAFVLKSPTFVWLFVLISLRALRFDPLEILVAGGAAVMGWAVVLAWTLADSPPGTVTRDFVAYMTGSRILIGAEVEKLIALSMFTAALAMAMHRGESFLRDLWTRTHELAKTLRKEKLLIRKLEAETQERVRANTLLRDALYKDSLTGSASSAWLDLQIEERSSLTERASLLLVLIDLCQFRQFNEVLGHNQGNGILISAARLLEADYAGRAQVFRVSSDEFALLFDDEISVSDSEAVCRELLQLFELPLGTGAARFSGGVNIGAALAKNGSEAIHLRSNASLALNAAKRRGRQHSQVYSKDQRARAEALARIELALPDALKRRELFLAYQPIVHLQTRRLAGWEALLRWNSPEFGEVAPSDFIPVLEETGRIDQIGCEILGEAVRDAEAMSRQLGRSDLFVSVNVSAKQLNAPEPLISAVGEAVSRYANLKLELTESCVANDPDSASEVLFRLKRAGALLAIDDFGTGMSSLAHIHRYPFDTIKLDRTFVQSEHGQLTRGIVQLADSIRLSTIAEGIETRAQMTQMRDMGATYGQGFLWGRAAPLSSWLTGSPASFE